MPSQLTPKPPTRDQNFKAAIRIARFRNALDWMLNQPTWISHFAEALAELGLRGQRQGISLERAIRTLPLEQKFMLVRHALSNGLPALDFSQTKRFASLHGVSQYSPRADFSNPSSKEWLALVAKVALRLSGNYKNYKSAQSEIYSALSDLPARIALGICRLPSLREDCCQEARLALLEAIDRIEPNQNFEAYASQWIKRRIQNFLIQERLPVKTPLNLLSKILSGSAEKNQLLKAAIESGTVRLDDAETSLPELLDESTQKPAEAAEQGEQSQIVTQALARLSDKQREVVVLRFGLDSKGVTRSLAEVAKTTGISRQQVFQREKRALAKLSSLLAPLNREIQPAGALA